MRRLDGGYEQRIDVLMANLWSAMRLSSPFWSVYWLRSVTQRSARVFIASSQSPDHDGGCSAWSEAGSTRWMKPIPRMLDIDTARMPIPLARRAPITLVPTPTRACPTTVAISACFGSCMGASGKSRLRSWRYRSRSKPRTRLNRRSSSLRPRPYSSARAARPSSKSSRAVGRFGSTLTDMRTQCPTASRNRSLEPSPRSDTCWSWNGATGVCRYNTGPPARSIARPVSRSAMTEVIRQSR